MKVQYPQVKRAIESDFGPSRVAAAFISVLFPNARIDDFIGEARARFLEECDYRAEARAQQRFAAIYADNPLISVPKVHTGFCSEHLLTTTWIEGSSFDEYLATN